jgi:hypothetical protein
MLLGMFLMGCSGITSNLKREVLKNEKLVPGNYTVIFYGARYNEDLETIALLDYEDDEYTFEPFANERDYSTHKYEEDPALTESITFVSWYQSYWRTQLSRITDENDRLLGYELRPLYHSISTYGYSDVLNVYYELKDKKVVIHVRLKRDVEKAIEGDGNNGLIRERFRK